MYNLEVEGLHTYYVTDDRVLVHNEYGSGGSEDVGDKTKETGSYVIEFESGKVYVGKGPRTRMEQSAKFRSQQNNDIVKSKTWESADNDIEAFIDEFLKLLKHGGPKSDSNYNVIESPGKKYFEFRDGGIQ